ncbi:PTS sugar transporter subunit IIA [Mammaliicoccus sciuri]|uniref:PTS sugar transporter subunit IIA n=1 Tax=Mammaliicoccus sciuri TaxID=1296 RepID=UPI000E6893A1|nr:PTS sugar transporter subunit IIA [Mammaliicoccus sciuri]RIO17958.1 PTS sugar transporter subunit IIA [Mammaliicoccus sciuri]
MSLLNENLIYLDCDYEDKDSFFDWFSNEMLSKGYVKESFKESIKEREKNYPTGLVTQTCELAIPHTDPNHLIKPFISFIRLKKPISFIQMGIGDEMCEAKLLFVLGVTKDGGQVEVLSKLMNLFMQEKEMELIINEQNKFKIEKIINDFIGGE